MALNNSKKLTAVNSNSHMEEIKQQVLEVLHNVNWMLEAHDSYAELVEVNGRKVVIRHSGRCADCETNCVGVAFQERMPHVEVILQ